MSTPSPAALGAYIRHQREQQHLSCRRLAHRAGVDSGTLTRLEHGTIHEPMPRTLMHLADGLGVPVATLFTVAGYLPADQTSSSDGQCRHDNVTDAYRADRPGGDETIAVLRAIADPSPRTRGDALNVAESQADQLRQRINPHGSMTIATLDAALPSVHITTTPNLLHETTAVFTNGHWHILVDANTPPQRQLVRVLRRIKEIVDQPVRQAEASALTESEWDYVTNYFAQRVVN